MKVSINWLKELVDLKVPIEEVIKLLPLRTIGVKEVTQEFFELDMKGYNRADLLSLRGVAREVAAITGSKLNFTDQPFPEYDLPETPVKIENGNLAPVYCVLKIEGLKVTPSNPGWIKKLDDSGIRSVNNIVDITNLLMIEYGQDMHAFDANCVTKEELTTIDGKKLKLSLEDLIIADPQKPVGLAGIMGGKDSEVSEKTHTILLEITIFDPVTIRKTSQRYGVHSEAAKRVQHGLTKTNLLQAMSAAIKMYESLGGKLTAINLTGNLKDEPKTIKLTQEKINSLIGINIPAEQIENSLKKLGFTLATQGHALEATVPYYRLDINIEEDLIEEIARMYGYEKIPAKELVGEAPQKVDQSFFELIYKLKSTLANLGLTEIQTYSFYSTKILNNLKLNTEDLIKIANPMSAETEYLRDRLWPNLLEATAKNIRNGIKDVAIFEIGKVFSPKEGGTPKENYHLSIALSNGTDNPIAELNQIAKSLSIHPEGVKLDSRYLHPTRHTDYMAEVHPRFVNKFGIEQRVAVLEIEIKAQQ